MAAELRVLRFPTDSELTPLLPASSPESEPFFAALDRGALALQRCLGCERFRMPVAPVCPYCGSVEFSWRDLSGTGTVHSWVRYHRAFLAEFETLVPYCVLTVQLSDGPFMFGRLVGDEEPTIGMPVEAVIEVWADDRRYPAFTAAGGQR